VCVRECECLRKNEQPHVAVRVGASECGTKS